jgi:hypothetical protein
MTCVHGPEIGQSGGMRTLAALTVLIACGATATSISAGSTDSVGSTGKAYLRLVDRDPLTIQGRAFKSRERVRVVASVPAADQTMTSGSELVRKTVRATVTGSFRVTFSEITVDRCSLVRVTSVGARGSMAVLKVLPSPMCTPALTP